MNKIKNTIAISSCKGGVGKSTVSAGLAFSLVQKGFKVGLVDVDIHGPSIPSLFGIDSSKVSKNDKNQLIPVETNGIKIMSFGFLLGDGPAVLRGPIASQYVQQVILNTAWGELDYLLIDLPPGTGDIQLTITQQLALDGAIIITTPQSLSLLDVSRGIIMFEKVNVRVLGVVENMSYFKCGQCDTHHKIFGKLPEKYFENKFGIDKIIEFEISDQYSNHPSEYGASDNFTVLAESIDTKIKNITANPVKEILKIKSDENVVFLKWEDGSSVTIDHKALRLQCPCAHCVDEFTGEQKIKAEDIKDTIAPKEITPLGNYAISIAWNDGHSTGIYPFKFLKELQTAV